MPTGIYKRTKPAWNKGIKRYWDSPTEFKKGHPAPKTAFKKGLVPWNKGKKGVMPIPWNKGIKSPIKPWLGKKRLEISGENSSNWKGGVTPINLQIRQSLEYKLWRRAVFERDNFQCIIGGKEHGSKLNADHIKPFADYPELRFAIDNGRTLCVDCHRVITAKYLKKNWRNQYAN